MRYKMKTFSYSVIGLLLMLTLTAYSQERVLAEVEISESAGIDRENEFVEIDFQSSVKAFEKYKDNLIARESISGQRTPCQIIYRDKANTDSIVAFSVVFPVSVTANSSKRFTIQQSSVQEPILSDLKISGSGVDLIIENQYFRADLNRSDDSEAKRHASGQLRQLLIKLGFNQLLFRTENRMHWAPNFQRTNAEYYQTIAGWEYPAEYHQYSGPYLVTTVRSDAAPDDPEIHLTASYTFYAGKPYFIFYSLMEMIRNIELKLLRNDEMTMDSMFTNLAFQRPDGRIEDYRFSQRYPFLEKQSIENEAPWLCFYHEDKKYGFGTIRLRYDITDRYGNNSPTFLPHTMISDGAEGGKYWNRRLIHEHPLLVPAGSRYLEKNAYLVFTIKGSDPYAEILHWSKRLRQPLQVKVVKYYE